MEATEKVCDKLARKLERIKRRMPPEDMDKLIVDNGEDKDQIKEVKIVMDELVEAIENLVVDYRGTLGDTKVKQWQD